MLPPKDLTRRRFNQIWVHEAKEGPAARLCILMDFYPSKDREEILEGILKELWRES